MPSEIVNHLTVICKSLIDDGVQRHIIAGIIGEIRTTISDKPDTVEQLAGGPVYELLSWRQMIHTRQDRHSHPQDSSGAADTLREEKAMGYPAHGTGFGEVGPPKIVATQAKYVTGAKGRVWENIKGATNQLAGMAAAGEKCPGCGEAASPKSTGPDALQCPKCKATHTASAWAVSSRGNEHPPIGADMEADIIWFGGANATGNNGINPARMQTSIEAEIGKKGLAARATTVSVTVPPARDKNPDLFTTTTFYSDDGRTVKHRTSVTMRSDVQGTVVIVRALVAESKAARDRLKLELKALADDVRGNKALDIRFLDIVPEPMTPVDQSALPPEMRARAPQRY